MGASALRIVLDPVVNTLINLTANKEPIDSAVLDGLLASVPDSPKFGSLSPRSIAASLAHLIVNHLGVKHSKSAPPPKSKPAAPPPPHVVAKSPVKPFFIIPPTALHPAAPTPPHVINIPAIHAAAAVAKATKPPGYAHAATHSKTLATVNTLVTHV